jgi:hypothetical protein
LALLGSEPDVSSIREQRTFLEGRGSSVHDPEPILAIEVAA